MDPKAFLGVAERLRDSNNEAECRTSVGRSYYALYNAVIGILKSKGVVFRETPQDHQSLVDYMTRVGSRIVGPVALTLKNLRTERNVADYNMSRSFDAKKSNLQYRLAKDTLDDFEKIPVTDLESLVARMKEIP